MFDSYEDAATVPASVNDLILVIDACRQGNVSNGQTAVRDTIMLVVSRILMEDGVRKVMVKQVDNSLNGAVNSFMLDGMNCTYIPTTKGYSVENRAVAPTTEGESHLADMIDNQSGIMISPTGNVVLDYLYGGECPMARTAHRACEDGMLVCACQDCLGPFTNLRTDKMPYMPCPVCVGRDIASEARDFREAFVDSYCTDIGALMDMIGRINQRRAAMGYAEPARFNDRDWGIDMDLSRAYNDDAESEFEADFDDGDEPPLPLNPVSMATIDTLRTILTGAMLGEEGNAKCSICAEDPIMGSEIVALPCGHWFDSTCIENWFATSNTCPNCRKVVMEIPKEAKRLEKNRLKAELDRLEAQENMVKAELDRRNTEESMLEAEVNRLDAVHRLGTEIDRLDTQVHGLGTEMNRLDAETARLETSVNRFDTEMPQEAEQKEEEADVQMEDEDEDMLDVYEEAAEEQSPDNSFDTELELVRQHRG